MTGLAYIFPSGTFLSKQQIGYVLWSRLQNNTNVRVGHALLKATCKDFCVLLWVDSDKPSDAHQKVESPSHAHGSKRGSRLAGPLLTCSTGLDTVWSIQAGLSEVSSLVTSSCAGN